MKAIELTGDIDGQHCLHANVPENVPVGQVRLLVFLPEEDDGGSAWARGVGHEWADELGDVGQDIYTLADGQPANATR